VVVVPGKFFHCAGAPSPYVRLSFASASGADFDAGMARLAQLLRSLPGAPPRSA
jgi:DNA-binding transcriptional MocR family regulator